MVDILNNGLFDGDEAGNDEIKDNRAFYQAAAKNLRTELSEYIFRVHEIAESSGTNAPLKRLGTRYMPIKQIVVEAD